MSDTNLAWGCV